VREIKLAKCYCHVVADVIVRVLKEPFKASRDLRCPGNAKIMLWIPQ